MSQPIWVAHRGFPAQFPENSLPGFQAAIEAGARFIEMDVQMSADAVPMVYHDIDLVRVSDQSGQITDLTADKLQKLSAAESNRFADRFKHVTIITLAQAVEFLQKHPAIHCFIEIKSESLQKFSRKLIVEKILECVKPVLANIILITFDAEFIQLIKQASSKQQTVSTGWIMEDYNAQSFSKAKQLQANFLICDIDKIPDDIDCLWQGQWQWMVYVTEDLQTANKFFALGASYIETDNIGLVMQKMNQHD